ncbi:hypothetical protein QHF83_13930 [Polyangium sp. 15x6]|nr:hypothetical protein [Polyangium sp. 15x6]
MGARRNIMRGFFAAMLGIGLLGCGASEATLDGPDAPTQASMQCEGPQPPVVQNVRWLGPAKDPGKAPLAGVAVDVNKAFAFEQGVEVTVREVKYTPVAADRNLAMARVTVRHGSETKDVSLGRELPGGKVCYQQATGVWVGLVETVPNKAMLRVGLPPAEP